MVFFKNTAILGICGRTDTFELATRQGRLQQIRCIKCAARGRAGADDGVNFIDEQDAVGAFLELLEHGLEALFEITTVLGPCQQCAHIQRVHNGILENVRYIVLGDTPCQALSDGGLADTSFADQQRIVLAAPAQGLNHALDFGITTDQRIDLAFGCGLVQILCELVEWAFLLLAFALHVFRSFWRFLRIDLLILAHTMRNEIDYVQAGDALLVQIVDSMRILLAENRHEHIGSGHFLFAVRCRLHMHDGALDHALEAQRRLSIHFIRAGHRRRIVGDEVGQRLAQVIDIDRASTQHFCRRWIIQQRKQQVLHRNELMTRLSSLDKGHVQTDFQFLRNHASSITHCRGCPAFLVWVNTSSTFVDAISLGYTPHIPFPSR